MAEDFWVDSGPFSFPLSPFSFAERQKPGYHVSHEAYFKTYFNGIFSRSGFGTGDGYHWDDGGEDFAI